MESSWIFYFLLSWLFWLLKELKIVTEEIDLFTVKYIFKLQPQKLCYLNIVNVFGIC